MAKIEELLKDNMKIPSPPAIAVKILETLKRHDSSFRDLTRIISSDPALTLKILSVANSSFYTLPYKVDNIEKALHILGTDVIKNIALSFVITKGLTGNSEGQFDFEFFWKRSITAAAGGELITQLVNHKSDDTFVTSLLQDIGIIIMYYCNPLDYLQVLDEKRASGLPVEVVEKRIFGFDHQELGSEVLKKWGIPENIYEPIRFHHMRNGVPEKYRIQSEILLLSDKVSSVYHGTRSTEKLKDISLILSGRFKVNGKDVESLIDSVAQRSVEILSIFSIDSKGIKPFSQILQEANEELGKLNLSYEQLVMELKRAKEKAEKLAYELKEANTKLREFAFRDGLTGLFNHRYFQEQMERELYRAQRYERPLSLIIFDIDHFKKINDTYGHPAGDEVLKTISSTITDKIRDSDIASRYGGEEFTVILPETDAQGAAVLAERLRSTVEKTDIMTDGTRINITISLGVVTYHPEKGKVDKSLLIDAADKVLYISKKNGRNKVSVANI